MSLAWESGVEPEKVLGTGQPGLGTAGDEMAGDEKGCLGEGSLSFPGMGNPGSGNVKLRWASVRPSLPLSAPPTGYMTLDHGSASWKLSFLLWEKKGSQHPSS